MNLRLTPLNIVSSILLVSAAYLLIFPNQADHVYPGSLSLLLMFVLCFVTDIVFRRLIKVLKRIWLFELLFIIFVALLTILIKLYIFTR